MLSVKGFFSVASLASLLPFVPVCLSSVSDPCPYPSCLCLPLRTSFSRIPHAHLLALQLPTPLPLAQDQLQKYHNLVTKYEIYRKMRLDKKTRKEVV